MKREEHERIDGKRLLRKEEGEGGKKRRKGGCEADGER